MPRRLRKALLTLSLALGIAVLVAASLWWWAPRALENRVRTAVTERTHTLGVQATFESLRLASLRSLELDAVCVGLPDAPPAFCIDRLRIGVVSLRPWPPRPESVRATGGWVDPDATHALVRHVRDARRVETPEEMEETPPTAPLARLSEALSLRARAIEIRQEGAVLATVEHGDATLGPSQEASGRALIRREGDSPIALPSGLALHLPEAFEVKLRADGGPESAEIRSDNLDFFRVHLDGGPTLWVRGARMTWPGTLEVDALRLEIPSEEIDLRIGRTDMVVRAFTLNPEVLHFERLVLDGVEATLPFPAALVRNSAAAEESTSDNGDPRLAAEEETEAEVDPTPAPAAEAEMDPAAADGTVAMLRSWFTSRRWYEAIPQYVEIRNADLNLRSAQPDGDATTWRIKDLELRYALRVLRFQMDLDLAFVLAAPGAPDAQVGLEAVWGYTQRNVQLSLETEGLPLVPLLQLVTGRQELPLDRGTLDLDLRYRETRRPEQTRLDGSLRVQDLSLHSRRLRDTVEVDDLTWRWEAAAEAESPDSESIALRFSEGEGQLNGARFMLRPHLLGWSIDRWPPFRSIDLELDIPDQPAMRLFEAIPMGMRRDLEGVRMEGEFGFGLRFHIDLEGEPPGRAIRIGAPLRHSFRDGDLRLVQAPATIDPRRLASSFRFTFLGPEGRIQRPIFVPDAEPLPPRPAPRDRRHDRAEVTDRFAYPGPTDIALPTIFLTPESEPPTPSEGLRDENWARLDEISWYLIAMQLHREDGRFFTNTGINWYQFRRLAEEAWAERRGFSRGASTITMQLVKNVLLTHERTVERKVQELFLSYWLTRHVPKERILEIYLNVIEWGPGVNGIVEAADWYFGKQPGELTLGEATWLSAITPAPLRRSRQRELGEVPDWYWRHCQQLMRSLQRRRWITESELQEGLARRPRFVTESGVPAPTAVEEGISPELLSAAGEGLDRGANGEGDAGAPRATGLLARPPEERIHLLVEQALPLRDRGGGGLR